jgi:hypothetical protein
MAQDPPSAAHMEVFLSASWLIQEAILYLPILGLLLPYPIRAGELSSVDTSL